MAEYTVKQHFRNGARTFRFTNEADKEEAERMANEAAEEAKVSSAEEVENAMKRCNELKEEIDVKNAELEEAKQVIVDYKEPRSTSCSIPNRRNSLPPNCWIRPPPKKRSWNPRWTNPNAANWKTASRTASSAPSAARPS